MIVRPLADPVLGMMQQTTVGEADWEELGACPVCGRTEHLEDLGTVAGRFTGAIVAMCTDCEHIFKRRRPTTEWFDRYYARDWDAPGQAAAPPVTPRTKLLDFCQEHLPERARVLDIGAGFGNDILAFRHAGHEAHALESSEHRARHIDETFGIPTVCGPFESADVPGDLDLVASNHVLEHIADPGKVYARAFELLKVGGLVETIVPNCLSFEHTLQFMHYAPHQSGFSLKSMTRLHEAHGFEVVKTSETREVRILARKVRSPQGAPQANGDGTGAFRERARHWNVDGYGDSAGTRTLLWWRGGGGKSRCYQGAVLPGAAMMPRAIDGARSAFERLPPKVQRRYRKRLPPYLVRAQLRMLRARIEDPAPAPVVVAYDGAEAPVWVK